MSFFKFCVEILDYTPLFFLLFSFAISTLLCTNEPPEVILSNEKIEKSNEDPPETSPSQTNVRSSEANAEVCSNVRAQIESNENQSLGGPLTDRDKILMLLDTNNL
ncbi:unnamed protein product [Cylicocyclus nassatus]|uniref:Uncharacterized protein n=1 Tax=Cylicocyclus nassatus TaxID=53992 RepID=A0AA36H4L4_CYLNA|nr:unnamed protein product [Cylicocyclus nassatus]